MKTSGTEEICRLLGEDAFITDGHEDIAWHMLAHKRSFSEAEDAKDAMVTLEGLRGGGVLLSIASLFVQHDLNKNERQEILAKQFRLYDEICEKYEGVRKIAFADELVKHLEAWRCTQKNWGFCVMMEGADLLESPEDLARIWESGVRVMSLTWNEENQWAGGAKSDGRLTTKGREFLTEMERIGFILDVSHLNEKSFWDVMRVWDGQVVATHSNCHRICPHPRNLKDEQIKELRDREAVVGILLFNGFLNPDWTEGDKRLSMDAVCAHAYHLLEILGESGVGLGSDFDGGIEPADTPCGLDRVSDLWKVAEALLEAGIPKADVKGIMGENWVKFLASALPKS